MFVVRTVEDGHSISGQLSPEKHVVILGASFIGQYLLHSAILLSSFYNTLQICIKF